RGRARRAEIAGENERLGEKHERPTLTVADRDAAQLARGLLEDRDRRVGIARLEMCETERAAREIDGEPIGRALGAIARRGDRALAVAAQGVHPGGDIAELRLDARVARRAADRAAMLGGLDRLIERAGGERIQREIVVDERAVMLRRGAIEQRQRAPRKRD